MKLAYWDNPVYTARKTTDKFFGGDFNISLGNTMSADALDFVSKHQLYKDSLWRLFEQQFAIAPDSSDGGWRGEYWGKCFRGACMTYQITGDKKLYNILKKSVRNLMALADNEGRISTYAKDKEFNFWDMWCRKYVMLGMLYFYDICTCPRLRKGIIASLKGQADYICAHIGDEDGKKKIVETTGNTLRWHHSGLNSSSILEPIVRLYNITKESKYLELATHIVSFGGCKVCNLIDLVLANEKIHTYPIVKAYEMMSFFEGVLEYYRTTGIEKYKTAFINFANLVIENELTITGGSGCTHEYFDNSALAQTREDGELMQETCVTVTLMKMLSQAFVLTGEAKYADAVENAYYNAMLSAVNFNKNVDICKHEPNNEIFRNADILAFIKSIEGFTFDSYSPLYKGRRNCKMVGGFRVMEEGKSAYGCCVCIGSAGLAVLPLLAVSNTSDGIAINHFLDGTYASKSDKAGNFEIKMSTNYPYAGAVKINWSAQSDFTLKIRVPSYCNEMKINGNKVDCLANTYYDYNAGKKGEIDVEFVYGITVHTLNNKVAVKYGAIALALDERLESVDVKLTDNIVKIEDAKIEFESKIAKKIEFSNGKEVVMIDYMTAGNNWDDDDCRISVWNDVE